MPDGVVAFFLHCACVKLELQIVFIGRNACEGMPQRNHYALPKEIVPFPLVIAMIPSRRVVLKCSRGEYDRLRVVFAKQNTFLDLDSSGPKALSAAGEKKRFLHREIIFCKIKSFRISKITCSGKCNYK